MVTRLQNISIAVQLKGIREISFQALKTTMVFRWRMRIELVICLIVLLFIIFLSSPTKFDEVLEGMETRVTQEMNEELLRSFEASKVQVVLMQMKANTASGPDGLPPLFYKQY